MVLNKLVGGSLLLNPTKVTKWQYSLQYSLLVYVKFSSNNWTITQYTHKKGEKKKVKNLNKNKNGTSWRTKSVSLKIINKEDTQEVKHSTNLFRKNEVLIFFLI